MVKARIARPGGRAAGNGPGEIEQKSPGEVKRQQRETFSFQLRFNRDILYQLPKGNRLLLIDGGVNRIRGR
jgi:hypothetical protein